MAIVYNSFKEGDKNIDDNYNEYCDNLYAKYTTGIVAIDDECYNMAFDQQHAYGYEAVEERFEELTTLAKNVMFLYDLYK